MASTLPQPADCCSPCDGTTDVAVPGPSGAAGAAGTNGDDGVNAYTTTTAQFTMPAEGADVSVAVADSTWMTATQLVYVQNAGYMQVRSKASALEVTLRNMEATAASEYIENAAPTTVIASSSSISPAGIQGPAGTDGSSGAPDSASYWTRTSEGSLSGESPVDALTDGALIKTDPGGSGAPAAAVDGTDYLSPSTGLVPSDIGINVQAFDDFLAAIAALGTGANKLVYVTGVNTAAETALTSFARTLLDDANAAAARVTLGVLSGFGLLGSLTGVDLNSAATDNAVTMNSTNYIVTHVVVTNASTSLTTATAGLFNSAGGSGTICADQGLTALTASGKFHELTISGVGSTDRQTAAQLQFRCGTAQGAAATVDVYIYGRKLD